MPGALTVGIEPQGTSVRAMGEVAAAADAAGLDAAWAPELYHRSATISVAEMANRTRRCTVGTAIAYGVGRSPLTLAAEARDLDELADGRFVLGLGNGTRRMMADWHGADPEAPAVRMEELVPLVRRLWRMHEGPVEHEGRFYRVRFRPTGELPAPARAIPVYTAGREPADDRDRGTRRRRAARPHPVHHRLPAGRGAARRSSAGPAGPAGRWRTCASRAWSSRRSTRMRSWPAPRSPTQIAFYASAKTYAPLLERTGFGAAGEAIRAAFARGDVDAMVAAVPERMVDALAVAGTAADVRAGLRRYEGLLDHAILYAPSFRLTPERVHANTLGLIEAVRA